MAIKINSKHTLVYMALLFCVITLFFIVANIIRFSNKGFELSDETFYLYFSWHFNSNTYSNTNFGLLNKLVCFNNPNLVNLRFAKFIYQTLAVLVFVFSIFKFLEARKYFIGRLQKTFILLIALMASYVNYDYLPMTLSYNTWSLVLMLLCFSLVFLEYNQTKKYSSVLTSICFGFICFGLFLTKYPNAFIALFIYFLFNLFSIKNNLGYKILGLIIGVFLGYVVFVNNIQDLKNILHNYYAVIFDIKHIKANSYADQLFDFLILCYEKQFLIIELLVIVLSVIIKKHVRVYKNVVIYIPLVINYYLSTLFFEGNSAVLYNDFLVASLFIINVFLFVYLSSEQKEPVFLKRDYILIIVALFLMPIGLMLGTNNLFYYTTSQTMIFSIIASLIFLIITKQLSLTFLVLKTTMISVFALSVLYHGAVKNPYRQNNLLEKNYPLHFTDQLNGIYESHDRFVDYTAINYLTNHFNKSKKEIVTFFNHFGLCYLNGCEVFPESQISDSESLIGGNEYLLKRVKFDTRADLLIVPESIEGNSKFKEMFSKFGVKLNENYQLVYVYQFLSTHEKIYFYKKAM